MNNQKWQTGTPPKDERYLVSVFNCESGDHFHSTSFYFGEWPTKSPYMITGWIPLPDLPEAPKDVPQVEKITWYPLSVKPNKPGIYMVKGDTVEGVTVYENIIFENEWPATDFKFWTEDIKVHG